MQKEKFLVIGSNSFSGAHFVAGALRAGAEVVGTSRSAEPNDVFLPYKWMPHERFTFHALDLNHDLDAIESVARAFEAPYIVNFAAQSMVAQSWANPDHWFMTNTVSMVKLHERVRKFPFLKKYVHVSTPEVYGSCSGLVPETAPFNPSTPYAASKAACDLSLLTFKQAYDFPVVFTRAANVAGPAQQLFRIIPKTVLCILTGQKLRLEGGGHSVRSFIHMEDVVEGTIRIARDGTPGEAYHLSTDRNQSIRDVVTEVCGQMNVNFEDHVTTTPGRLGQDAAYLLDCTKIRTQLGWKSLKTVENIVAETIDWVTKNLQTLRAQPADYIHKA